MCIYHYSACECISLANCVLTSCYLWVLLISNPFQCEHHLLRSSHVAYKAPKWGWNAGNTPGLSNRERNVVKQDGTAMHRISTQNLSVCIWLHHTVLEKPSNGFSGDANQCGVYVLVKRGQASDFSCTHSLEWTEDKHINTVSNEQDCALWGRRYPWI